MCTRTTLENVLDNSVTKITFKMIGDAIGIHQTSISKFFSGKKELSFYNKLRVVQYIDKANEKEIVREIITEYAKSKKPADVRCALLYLAVNNMYEDLETLGSTIEPKQRENTVWYDLIKLFVLHKRNEIKADDLTSKLHEINYDSTDCRALKTLLMTFANYTLGIFTSFFDNAKRAEELVLSINSDYIREAMYVYVCEMYANAYLFQRADTKKCRFYLKMIFSNKIAQDKTKIYAEYTMGLSYIFEDFDKSLSHLSMYVQRLRQIGQNNRADLIEGDDIAFLYNYWWKDLPQGSDHFIDSQKSLRYYIEGNKTAAQDIAMSLSDTAFDVYVKGYVFEDDCLLVASVGKFREKDNEFFVKLPMESIKKEYVREVLKTKTA